MDGYVTTPLAPFAPAIGANFNTFTTRQDVSPLPLSILPGNVVRPGSAIKIEAEGEWSATATPTLVLGFYAGIPGASGGGTITSILAESVASTLSANTSFPWRMEYRGKFVTIGTAGSIVGSGDLEMGTTLSAFTSTAIPITLALRTVAINTTVANAIGVCATFSASNASNNVRVYQMTALLLN
jgi:hypothetical protein